MSDRERLLEQQTQKATEVLDNMKAVKGPAYARTVLIASYAGALAQVSCIASSRGEMGEELHNDAHRIANIIGHNLRAMCADLEWNEDEFFSDVANIYNMTIFTA